MDWVTAKTRTKQRTPQEGHEEGSSAVHLDIFVKVNGSSAFMLDVAPNVKRSDIVRRITNSVCCSKCDMCVTFEGQVPRGCDELKSCGISGGSVVQVTRRMRGGGKHKQNQPTDTAE